MHLNLHKCTFGLDNVKVGNSLQNLITVISNSLAAFQSTRQRDWFQWLRRHFGCTEINQGIFEHTWYWEDVNWAKKALKNWPPSKQVLIQTIANFAYGHKQSGGQRCVYICSGLGRERVQQLESLDLESNGISKSRAVALLHYKIASLKLVNLSDNMYNCPAQVAKQLQALYSNVQAGGGDKDDKEEQEIDDLAGQLAGIKIYGSLCKTSREAS
ncbi:hypothetical protein ACA910_001485 [Epithemia clementina (nom. ined.)]